MGSVSICNASVIVVTKAVTAQKVNVIWHRMDLCVLGGGSVLTKIHPRDKNIQRVHVFLAHLVGNAKEMPAQECATVMEHVTT